MTTQSSTQPRRRVRAPFLTLTVAIALVAGLAIGVQALRSAPSADAIGGGQAPAAAVNRAIQDVTSRDENLAANTVPHAVRTPGGPSQACSAIDARARAPYCDSSQIARFAAPKVTWLACEAMDVTAYRQYCQVGDGGRWVEGSKLPGQ